MKVWVPVGVSEAQCQLFPAFAKTAHEERFGARLDRQRVSLVHLSLVANG